MKKKSLQIGYSIFVQYHKIMFTFKKHTLENTLKYKWKYIFWLMSSFASIGIEKLKSFLHSLKEEKEEEDYSNTI